MMRIQIKYQDGVKFLAQARNHQFAIDRPKERGGSNTGMNSLEVFLSSLGGCISFYVRKYCQDVNIDSKGLVVDVESELSQERPFRFKDIRVKISLEQDIGGRKWALLKFVKNCPIHNTLSGQVNIEIEV